MRGAEDDGAGGGVHVPRPQAEPGCQCLPDGGRAVESRRGRRNDQDDLVHVDAAAATAEDDAPALAIEEPRENLVRGLVVLAIHATHEEDAVECEGGADLLQRLEALERLHRRVRGQAFDRLVGVG